MVAYNKFYQFSEDLLSGVHDLQSSGSTLKVYLTNTAPSASDNAVLADLAGITEENGYTATDIQNDISRSGGTTSLTAVDVTFTASGGSFGPFRYAVIYNDTPTFPADPLICWHDYGSEVTVAEGETFKIDFETSLFTLG